MATIPAARLMFPVTKARVGDEIGRSGLRQSGGYIQEEFNRDLQQVQVRTKRYREMLDNSAAIQAARFTMENVLRQVDWRFEGESDKAEDRQRAEFVEQCLDDLDRSRSELLSDIFTFLWFGFAPLEIVYKRRAGYSADPLRSSRFNDAGIGWQKLALRSQESVTRWEFSDDATRLVAMEQQPAPDYLVRRIPLEKLVLFRTTAEKDNPEGRSLLRGAWFDWYFYKKLTEIAAIGAERDLAGLPVITAPAELFASTASADQQAVMSQLKKIVTGVKEDEQKGLIIPSAYDPDTKQPLYTFSLVSAAGSKQFDILGMIAAHERRILMALFSDFLLLGHEKIGTQALATSKNDTYALIIDAICQQVADGFNRQAIPRLAVANGWPMDRLPRMAHGAVQAPDVEALSKMLLAYTGAGGVFDPGLDAYVRQQLNWPDATEEPISPREQMEAEQAAAPAEPGGGDSAADPMSAEQRQEEPAATEKAAPAHEAHDEAHDTEEAVMADSKPADPMAPPWRLEKRDDGLAVVESSQATLLAMGLDAEAARAYLVKLYRERLAGLRPAGRRGRKSDHYRALEAQLARLEEPLQPEGVEASE